MLFVAVASCRGGADQKQAAIPVAVAPSVALMAAQVAVPARPAPNPLKNAYFGEQHVHTSYSLDAYLWGTRLKPTDAYRFAKGQPVEVNGQTYRISKPLDWAAVTDHAEYLGEMFSTGNPGAPGYDNPALVDLRGHTKREERVRWVEKYLVESTRGLTPQHLSFYAGPETTRSAWKVTIDAAQEQNDPGRFTTLIAYEWSAAPGGANLHRNVFFRDANVPDTPMSYIDINREDGLWDWMTGLEAKGMRVLAIPHNSNGSKTMMFAAVDGYGKAIDAAYARKRAHFEKLIEIMQVKGNSEVHRNIWGGDEFADFENADSIARFSGLPLDRRNFVRAAVIQGLVYERTLGVNPYKLGFVGGTDGHNGLAGDAEEYDWNGAHGTTDGTVPGRREGGIQGWAEAKDLNPGALTGVWAEENTREAIWDAMNRRETFATSGTRIKLRFFGGGLSANPKDPVAMVRQGYAKGIPMGSDLPTNSAAPTFAVQATKDPDGANLDRIQIIKGWADKDGKPHEKIIDVVWSGDRKPGANGKLPPVGNTVDLKMARYRNTIGSAALIGSWTDREFDPQQHALYYARALEIPTPRWSTYDAVKAGLPLLEGVPAAVQERAWSSPIWYSPK
ncbi:MAG: DUF3604 domain-containing protein [Proteobacteria bacterium]|nr:DUF3604 domain-containing protein [Pseudomonadota bacterium]